MSLTHVLVKGEDSDQIATAYLKGSVCLFDTDGETPQMYSEVFVKVLKGSTTDILKIRSMDDTHEGFAAPEELGTASLKWLKPQLPKPLKE